MAIEWRGKIDDPKWRGWADFGIATGSWLPAILWGVAFAILVRGLPVDADEHVVELSVTDVLNAYTLLGGLATGALFLFYGAVFLALKIRRRSATTPTLSAGPLLAAGDRAGRRRSGCGPNWPTARRGPGWCWRSRWSRSWRPSRWCGGASATAGRSCATTIVVAAVVILLFGVAVPESGAVDARPGTGT